MSARVKYHRWTPDEDAALERMLGDHRSADIARRLGLDVDQVNNHIARLGLSRKREGVYSVNELMSMLATDHKLIGKWIANGTLRGGRNPGRGRFGQYEIRDQDLVAFLTANPHLVDVNQVEAAYRQYVSERWITLGEAFHRGAAHIISLQHACTAGAIPEARKRGLFWVIPEASLARLVEGRRLWTSDPLHRHQLHLYDRMQRRHSLRRHRGKSLWGTRAALEAKAS